MKYISSLPLHKHFQNVNQRNIWVFGYKYSLINVLIKDSLINVLI